MAVDGVTDSTLPEDVASSIERPTASWRLSWVYPPQAVRCFKLESGQRHVIGRDVAATIGVDGGQASRQHAEIYWRGDAPSVRDSNSRNGTFVNGLRVSETVLRPGDVLRVGDHLGYVEKAQGDVAPGVTIIATGCWAGPALRRALAQAKTVAKTDLPLLFQGATGTGKERAARAVHEWSERPGPFVAINCAAIPEHLAEAELFGYRQGAFTGAEKSAAGHLRTAHRGTLLLDEVSDLPLSLQAKLLRAVEQGEVQAIGNARPTPIDVRFFAASQTPLADEVAGGKFRADLAARLNGMTIKLPKLSERKEEIPGLFTQLLMNRLGSSAPLLDVQLVERLMLYAWPGNVRELDLLVRRLLGLHGHELKLTLAHLAGTLLEGQDPRFSAAPIVPPREEVHRDERDFGALLVALRDCGGNVTRAANRLRISRQRAYRLLEQRSDVNLDALRKGELQ